MCCRRVVLRPRPGAVSSFDRKLVCRPRPGAVPRFDSGACFAALLGGPENGRWIIAPLEAKARTTRRYRANTFGLKGPVDRWLAIRAQSHDEVCRKGFNSEIGAFVQSYGSRELDASVLLIPLVGFLPPNDPRARSTVEAIERHLMADGFVLRYDPGASSDGLPGNEGAFLACSFWLADNLVLLGRRDDARRLFQRLLALRNDVGLLSEEYDPRTKRLVGNFPQAFSHITLVNTAYNLSQQHKPAEQRSGRPAHDVGNARV